MVQLEADEIMRLHVKIDEHKMIGSTVPGNLRVIPITGGSFSGDGIEGEVVEGGADWNTTHENGVVHVFAKYMLKTSDGEFIAIENDGLLDPSGNAIIRTRPTFQTNIDGKYNYLNYGVYVGELRVTPGVHDSVDIIIYKMR